MKRCPGCRNELPLDAFGINQARHDGRQGYCRTCHRQRNRNTQRRANRDQRLDAWRVFYGNCATCGAVFAAQRSTARMCRQHRQKTQRRPTPKRGRRTPRRESRPEPSRHLRQLNRALRAQTWLGRASTGS